MRARRVYVAGPMRGYPDFNFPAFDAASARLRAAGWVVLSPAEIERADGFDERGMTGNEPLEGKRMKDIVRRDIGAVLASDAIYLLRGWDKSTGALAELAVARWLGLEILGENMLGGALPIPKPQSQS